MNYKNNKIVYVFQLIDHQFYHKWAILTAPTSDTAGGPRGYLKLDINVTAKGQVPLVPAGELLENDEIEGYEIDSK